MSRRRVLLAPWLLAALLRAGIAGYYHSTVLSFFLHYLWRAASLSVGTLGTSWGGIGVVATSGFLLWWKQSPSRPSIWRLFPVVLSSIGLSFGVWWSVFFVYYLIRMPPKQFSAEDIAALPRLVVVQILSESESTIGTGFWLGEDGTIATCRPSEIPVNVGILLPSQVENTTIEVAGMTMRSTRPFLPSITTKALELNFSGLGPIRLEMLLRRNQQLVVE
jgi:hypothetical protein